MSLSREQGQILKVFRDSLKKTGSIPTMSDLQMAGISRAKIRHHFVGYENLKKIAESNTKGLKIANKDHKHADFTKEALGNIIKENNYSDGVFFISAVSPVSQLDWSESDIEKASQGEEIEAKNLFMPGFKSVQNFLKRRGAELILLPMPAHVKALKEQPKHYDARLKDYKKCFSTEYTFNSHLKAIEAYLNPQQINPLTGLKRLKIQRRNQDFSPGKEIKNFKTSLIVGHSKQMMETVPTGNDSHPRIIHSTGSLTTASYLRNRIGMIADEDHKLGGLIVEIEGDIFWIRQVQFNKKDGSFVDLGTRYYPNGTVTEERGEAFKMGDLHPGWHSDTAIEAHKELWKKIKPKRIFLEDFFDGASISHHLVNKNVSRALLPAHFRDLPSEISMAKDVLARVWDMAPKDAEIIATASNHPEHVGRYLEEGRYIRDCKENFDIAHRMVVMKLDGKNPLKEFLDPKGVMNWTDQNADYYVEGVQMNAHGHLGVSGARGSKIGHELSYGASMTAHTHAPSIYHNAYCVGHTSIERHGYNNGPNGWILCSGCVYRGGHMQLYMIIKGRAFKGASNARTKKQGNKRIRGSK